MRAVFWDGCLVLRSSSSRTWPGSLAYNGEVFNAALSDVPAKKDDLVAGTYTPPAPDGPSTIAVKIIDMLGEEVLVTELI